MARKRVITGIDIGSSKTVTIIVSIDDEDQLSVIGVAHAESRGVRKGNIVDIEEATSTVVSSLEAAERMAGYQVESAFVSVGGTHISSQNTHGVVAVADPSAEITESDVERVIEAAQAISLASARKIIHVLPRYFTVDSQEGIKDPVGMSGVRLEVDTHLVTGGVTSLKNLEKCLANVGIDTAGFVFGGLASAESVLTETEKELGVVLMDIGSGTTDIAIYVEGALSCSSVLPVGARNVTNDIAIGLRISLESAEKLKRFMGTEPRKVVHPHEEDEEQTKKRHRRYEDDDDIDISRLDLTEGMKTVSRRTLVDGIIRPRLNELFSMVVDEIKRSGFAGVIPAGLVITGGGAKTVGLSDAARRTVALPHRLGSPQDIKGVSDEVESGAYAAAMGIVRYGSKVETKVAPSVWSNLPKFFKNQPIKSSASRVVDLVKSLLP